MLETLRLFALSVLTFIAAPIVVIPLILLWIALWQFSKPLALTLFGVFLVLCYMRVRSANARERSELDAIPTEMIEKLTAATGKPGKILLRDAPPLFRSRLLTAAAYQSDCLYDPIDDNPNLSAIMHQIETDLQGLREVRGPCHRYWRKKQRILYERHGILWLSPKDLICDWDFDW